MTQEKQRRQFWPCLLVALIAFGIYGYHHSEPKEDDAEIATRRSETPNSLVQRTQARELAAQVPLVYKTAPEKKPRHRTVAELVQLFMKDRFCDAWLEMRRNKLDFSRALKILMALPDSELAGRGPMSPLQSLLDYRFSPLAAGDGSKEGPLPLTFYNALLLSGLLEGSTSESRDLHRAHELFGLLDQRDPTNSAFSFFDLQVMKDLGYGKQEIRDRMIKGFSRPSFDTYLTDVAQLLLRKGLRNASSQYLMIVAAANMPIPNYSRSWKLIQKYLDADDMEVARAAVNVSSQMMAPGSANGDRPEGYYWVAIEYAIGSAMFEHAWDLAYPGSPRPAHPDRRQLIHEAANRDRLTYEGLHVMDRWAIAVERAEAVDQDHLQCPSSRLEADFEKFRSEIRHLGF